MKLIKKLLPEAIKEPLRRFCRKNSLTLSQAGQDLWIYGEVFNEQQGGYFVDIGAHNGIDLSNTYILEKRYNWTGICIEANPIIFEQLKNNRNALCLNACLDGSEREVDFLVRGFLGGIIDEDVDNKKWDGRFGSVVKLKTTLLMNILTDNAAPRVIDYLSIDVEGAEERILSGFNFQKFTFKTITIERPTKLLRELFRDYKYILMRELPGLDCLYVHQDFTEEYLRNVLQFYKKKQLPIRWR
jgi:FkbM family methyltransferase